MDEQITPAEANEAIIKLLQQHVALIQGGKLGIPTKADIEFCGKLHAFINDNQPQL